MKQVNKILFPLDLTEKIDPLLPWVTTLVEKFDATLIVLFVTQDLASFTSFYMPHPNIKSMQDEAMKAAQQKMAEIRQAYFQAFPKVETRVVQGDPAEKILEVAQKEGADLIIMGTHGRKGLERAIFGSVCDKVVRNSKIPVLTIYPQ
ncbi:MAG: universal stress protein [Syntrophobacterales bacterium]|nr:universal stress protein [Syntrophobacterales bacterium]